jgi:hypothetical protein
MSTHSLLVLQRLVQLVEDSTFTVIPEQRFRTVLAYTGDGTDKYSDGSGGSLAAQIEYALLGYKGPEFYDTGIIYCPYIPVMVQRTIGPNDFAPRVGLLTRYGVVDNIFGANLYYHVILVQGLGTAFTPASQSVYF